MTYGQAMRRIILPQAYKRLLPPLGNEFVAMLKDSSLVSIIGMVELLRTAKQYASATFRHMEIYCFAALFYLVMTTVFSVFASYLEKRFGVYE